MLLLADPLKNEGDSAAVAQREVAEDQRLAELVDHGTASRDPQAAATTKRKFCHAIVELYLSRFARAEQVVVQRPQRVRWGSRADIVAPVPAALALWGSNVTATALICVASDSFTAVEMVTRTAGRQRGEQRMVDWQAR